MKKAVREHAAETAECLPGETERAPGIKQFRRQFDAQPSKQSEQGLDQGNRALLVERQPITESVGRIRHDRAETDQHCYEGEHHQRNGQAQRHTVPVQPEHRCRRDGGDENGEQERHHDRLRRLDAGRHDDQRRDRQ